uniref:bifunctional diguanylate cyclase/phosphodiesterase n=1 Tax=Ningiella ruwaisensis TaxID=2364274 RepID=UPI0010A0B6F3|nr:bifunctional diguanylate cyclase/phosphodiesterase [Ningiella ruwaisensis]
MINTLHAKFAKLIALIVLATAVIILAVVWNNLSQTVHKNISSGLKGAEYGFKKELSSFQNERIEQALLLFENANIAIFDNNHPHNTFQTELQSILLELEASQIGLFFPDAPDSLVKDDASVTFSAHLQAFLDSNASNVLDSQNSFYILNEQLYWGFIQPVSLPVSQVKLSIDEQTDMNLPGLFVSYLFDLKRLSSLSDALGMRLAFVYGDEQSELVYSRDDAISAEQLRKWQVTDNYWHLFNHRVIFGAQDLYTQNVALDAPGSTQVTSYLAINAKRVSENFIALQRSIALISLVGVALSILLGFYLATRITKPLRKLALDANAIAKGDYQHSLEHGAYTQEVNTLFSAFTSMKKAVEEREATITKQAQIDALTGIYNRSHIASVIDDYLAENKRFQVIGINIHGFRGINDVFGYEYGDECLKQLAKRISEKPGITARVTGGEIIWIPESPLSVEAIRAIKEHIEESVEFEGICIQLKTAVGILHCPDDAITSEEVFKRLNIVIDEAQITRKLLLGFEAAQEQKYFRRLQVITELKQALESNSEQLSLVYQPKIRLDGKPGIQLEALARWRHPALGDVRPDEFISIAEHAGFIELFTRWLVKQAFSDLKTFDHVKADIKLALNISADDVVDSSLPSFLAQQLVEHDIQATSILLELTERVIVKNPDNAVRHLRVLQDAGFKIAIDDFGTGYSSLSYLTKLPIDTLKIDRSFIYQLAESKENQAICKTILALATNFEMEVVAEGVEDAQSLALLAELGCDWGQGYLICRPVNRKQAAEWIESYCEKGLQLKQTPA